MRISSTNVAQLAMRRSRGGLPLALMATLIVALGGYTAARQDAFLTTYNIGNLLITTMPLALVSLGQANALLVGGFDISVAALMTMCVVTASFTMTPATSTLGLIPGALAVVGVGLATGLFNAVLIRVFRLPSIIATFGTFGILQGMALYERPAPQGTINLDVVDALNSAVSFMPYAFIGVVIVAALADVWLYRGGGGLVARAVGLDDTAAGRLGSPVGFVFVRALLISAFAASIASFFVAAQVQVGDPNVALDYTLTSIAAAVLGGASLAGGRGSFVGAVIGGLFLTEIINIVPFLGLQSSWAQMLVGGLTLLALAFFQGPRLFAQARGAINDFVVSRRRAGSAIPEPGTRTG
jgi:ribose transport system ATP-binding protein